MARTASGKRATRLSREQWLAGALEVLSQEGAARVRVRDLAKKLGVTIGSFYWHFADLEQFREALLKYWDRAFTRDVRNEVRDTPGDARAKALTLATHIIERGLSRYDVPIRAWAAQDPEVARFVRRVDRVRLAFVRELFREMGFCGADLDMRAQTFATFYSLEPAVTGRMSKKRRLAAVKLRHRMLTGRP